MTERTAAETERPGEGKTLGEVLKLYVPPFKFQLGYIFDSNGAMVADEPVLRVRGWGRISGMDDAEELQDAVGEHIAAALTEYWQKPTAEAIQAAIILCTFPSCLSAQTAAKSGEEIARLKGDIAALKAELSHLIAATKGQTFYHSDEAVNAEMGRLRGEVERTKCALENSMAAHKALATDALRALAGKVCTPEEGYVKATHCLRRDIEELDKSAYHRGVEEERVRCAEIAMQATAAYQGSDIPKAIADAIRATSPAPQKNTAECQEVCEWVRSSPVAITAGCNTTGGNDAYAIGFKFCPYCGKPIKVDNG